MRLRVAAAVLLALAAARGVHSPATPMDPRVSPSPNDRARSGTRAGPPNGRRGPNARRALTVHYYVSALRRYHPTQACLWGWDRGSSPAAVAMRRLRRWRFWVCDVTVTLWRGAGRADRKVDLRLLTQENCSTNECLPATFSIIRSTTGQSISVSWATGHHDLLSDLGTGDSDSGQWPRRSGGCG